jgi:hypothetical protein
MGVVMFLAACQVGERVFEIDEPVGLVRLDMSSGEVELRSVERDNVRIEHSGWCATDDLEEDAGLSVVEGELRYGGEGRDCGGELYVEIPLGVASTVCLDRGEVSVELGAPADLAVCTAAGEIDVVVPAGAYVLDLDVGAGELSTFGVSHSEDAEHHLSATLAAGELSISGL